MITATGWTWDYIDENMDLPRLTALSKYWSEWPPVHIAVAAYVGWGSSKKSSDTSELDTLLTSLPVKEFNPYG